MPCRVGGGIDLVAGFDFEAVHESHSASNSESQLLLNLRGKICPFSSLLSRSVARSTLPGHPELNVVVHIKRVIRNTGRHKCVIVAGPEDQAGRTRLRRMQRLDHLLRLGCDESLFSPGVLSTARVARCANAQANGEVLRIRIRLNKWVLRFTEFETLSLAVAAEPLSNRIAVIAPRQIPPACPRGQLAPGFRDRVRSDRHTRSRNRQLPRRICRSCPSSR